MEEFQGSGLGQVCAVVPVRNEAASIANVLRQLHRAGVKTCVIVVNGSTDETPHVAKQSASLLFDAFHIVNVFEALGPDVPKAVGTYVALRAFPRVEWFLYVDGDWKGSFGPMLNEYVSECIQSGGHVNWVHAPKPNGFDGLYGYTPKPGEELWESVLSKRFPDLQNAAPSRSPLLIRRQAFEHISPYWLHHPGRWFAFCALEGRAILPLYVSSSWDTRLVGNPPRSREHAVKMAETMLGDAVEGCFLLCGKKPIRRYDGRILDGYHSLRRTDILQQWQTGV